MTTQPNDHASAHPDFPPIDQLVARIAAAHQRLLDAIAGLSDEQLVAPTAADGWSVKDVLAHLAFWDNRLLHAIDPAGLTGGLTGGPAGGAVAGQAGEAAAGPQVYRLTPPLIADIPYAPGWLEAVNTRVYTVNRMRSLPEVRAEFDSTRRRLLGTVAGLTRADVAALDALTAPLGEPFSEMVVGAAEHYEEHAETLEQALG